MLTEENPKKSITEEIILKEWIVVVVIKLARNGFPFYMGVLVR